MMITVLYFVLFRLLPPYFKKMSEMETSTLDESQVEENRLSYEGINRTYPQIHPNFSHIHPNHFRTTSIGKRNLNSNGFKEIDEKSIQMCQESFKGKDKWSQKRCQGITSINQNLQISI